jgi:signal transduction histidine kinase
VRDSAPLPTAVRHEQLLWRLFALTRTFTLGQAAFMLGFHWHANVASAVCAGLIALLAVETVALVVRHMRRGMRTSCRVAALDVGLAMAALVANVAVIGSAAHPATTEVLYPYTVTVMAIIGLVFRRLGVSLVVAALSSSVYLTATAWRFGVDPNTIANATTYWGWALVGWFLADRLLGLSSSLDEARELAAHQEAELARERERARLSRALHDHVLQTLEFLGRDGWISEPRIRDHVAAEAAWLRDLVRGELDNGGGALSVALHLVVERQIQAGLRVELNTAGLRPEQLPDATVEALAGAATELLTNVRKHAGTNTAVVRAVSGPGTVTVTVLDRGRGFDPALLSDGVGLRESVVARIRDVRGEVALTSGPGAGTHVEITVPVPGGQSELAPVSRKSVTCEPEPLFETMPS